MELMYGTDMMAKKWNDYPDSLQYPFITIPYTTDLCLQC